MTLSDDLLTGAGAIAEYIGWDRRRIYYAVQRGSLPITRVGNLLVARKSELERALSAAATRTQHENELANDNNG